MAHKLSIFWITDFIDHWEQFLKQLTDEWLRKQWYIYTMEDYSAIKKNTFESVLMRWMKLEPIIQSEVSQKEKHQYSILMQIYMEFRKMVMITLYARQQKRHRCIEQSFGLCGRGWGWDDLGEWHWNMYIIICEMNCQSRFNAWYRVLGAGALGWPQGMGWGGRWEQGSGWGTRVHPWQIHVNVWQNQYSIVISLQLK